MIDMEVEGPRLCLHKTSHPLCCPSRSQVSCGTSTPEPAGPMAAIQPPCPTKRSIRRVAGFTVGVTENGVPLVAANVMDHHFSHSETLVYGQYGTANFLTNHN